MNRWRQLSFEGKSAAGVIGVVLLGVGGFVAAKGLAELVEPASNAAAENTVLVKTLTVDRTVVRRVRVVPRAARSGVLGTQVVLRTVTLPVVRKDIVTVAGPSRTVVETRGGKTHTNVVTSERVITRERVVTSERTRTVERLVTTTRVVTQTVPVTTTRVVTQTVPVTQTLRSTETVRVTETSEPVIVTVDHPVTVTVTVPPGKP